MGLTGQRTGSGAGFRLRAEFIVSKVKAKLQFKKDLFTTSPTQYYKCVNCGHVGNFGFVRQRGIECQKCKWDLLAEYDLAEYKRALRQRGIKFTEEVENG